MGQKIERICFLVASSFYDTYRHFTDQFAGAFERCGVEVLILNTLNGIAQEEILHKIIVYKPTLTCSFNIVYLRAPNHFIFDDLGIPHWTITVDPAYYYSHLFKAPCSLFSTVDRYECKLIRTQTERVFFLPHGVDQTLLLPEETAERCYDAVFIGSCYDYEGLRRQWQLELPSLHSEILDTAIEHFFMRPQITFTDAFLKVWDKSKVHLEGIDVKNLLFYLDHYIRGRTRIEMIRALTRFPIHIFGDLYPSHSSCRSSWDSYLKDQQNVTIHAPLPFLKLSEVLRSSKFSLNSMPFFKDGSHERVLMALACGSIPVSSPSRWLEEQFTIGQELLIYNPENTAILEEQICTLLQTEKDRQSLATQGRKKIAAHTWDQRALSALEVLPSLLEHYQEAK